MVHWGFIVCFRGNKALSSRFLHGIKLSIVSFLLFLFCCCYFLHGAAHKEGGAVGERGGTDNVEETEIHARKKKTTCMLCMKRESDMGVFLCVFWASTYDKMRMSVVVVRGTSLVIDG